VPKEKLNLLQVAAGGPAEPSATSTEIVRREFADANLGGEFLDYMPNHLFRHSFAPNSTGAAYTAKKTSDIDSSRGRPIIQKVVHPIRNGDGSNVTGLPAEVHNCPMPFALLKMANSQHRQFVPSKSAGEQKRKERPVTFTLHLLAVGRPAYAKS
jgi:hypothetical protein